MKYVPLKNSDEKIAVGKIVCVGQNYAKHALELGNEVPEFPLIFLKTATCMINSTPCLPLLPPAAHPGASR